MIRDQLVETVLLQDVLEARHSHQAAAFLRQITGDGPQIHRRIRLVFQEIEGSEAVEGPVLKDLVLPLRIVLGDRQSLGPGFLHQVVLMLHAEGLHRIIRQDPQELSLPAAGLQDFLSLQPAEGDPLVVLLSPQRVHRGGVSAGADHIPVIGHRRVAELHQAAARAGAQPDRDPLFRFPFLRRRQVLGRCRHIFYCNERHVRKRRAAGSAAYHWQLLLLFYDLTSFL